MSVVKPVMLSLLIAAAPWAAIAPAQGTQKFTGTITDSMCPAGNHSQMRMGPTNAECTIACNDAHGAAYILYVGKETYALSDQKTPQKFAGQKVTVTGKLDAKTRTIQVSSITASN